MRYALYQTGYFSDALDNEREQEAIETTMRVANNPTDPFMWGMKNEPDAIVRQFKLILDGMADSHNIARVLDEPFLGDQTGSPLENAQHVARLLNTRQDQVRDHLAASPYTLVDSPIAKALFAGGEGNPRLQPLFSPAAGDILIDEGGSAFLLGEDFKSKAIHALPLGSFPPDRVVAVFNAFERHRRPYNSMTVADIRYRSVLISASLTGSAQALSDATEFAVIQDVAARRSARPR